MPTTFAADYKIYTETVDPDRTVRGIVQAETNRIDLKKIKIDKEYATKERKEMLIASDTARGYAYNKMYLVITIMAVLSIGAMYSNSIFPLVPESILDLFVMAVVSGGSIYLVILYVDILKRDKVEYNKIDVALLTYPKEPDSNLAAVAATDGTKINTTAATNMECVGSECCPTGTIFVDNKCKKEGFCGTIKPYSNNRADYMLL